MPLSRRLRRFVAALVAALAALLPAATSAGAADGKVAGGRLDWGIKQSFLSYVTGPIAHGSWSLTQGAATVGGATFRFHSATGSYDPATGALSASFSGGVRFLGHQNADGSHQLDLQLSRFAVKADGSGGAGLYADVTGKDKDTGVVSSTSQTRLADLAFGGVNLRGATGTLTVSNVPATLTAAGAKAFGGFYTAGTALDPVTLSVNLPAEQAPRPDPAGPKPPAGQAPQSATPTVTAAPADPSSAPPGRTEFANGALDWGVRRTFRDYVTGAIAKGGWQLADGAADGGAFFRWTPGKGSYDPASGALGAAFTGRVQFRGMQAGDTWGLDLTLASPSVTVADGRGTLSADVTGRTPDGADHRLTGVPLGSFDPAALKVEGGLLKAVELPLQLTAEGAAALGSLYPAGTAMDPLSFAVALDPAAALPPLPDIGSAPPASPAASTPATPAASPVASATASGPSAAAVAAVVGGLLAVALAVAGGLLLRRRRRAA
ncbi:HtaA domain-containing protein [Kitasatospora sp. NPDC094015]|uniref:HtaA domain-containing protein n=1 Tax=Kitasatospora sp. NPDC094015 TaxID=3155205 RepID=UPI003326A91E